MRGATPSHGLVSLPAASMRARSSALSLCRVPGAACTKRGTRWARQVGACCSAPPASSAVEPSESQRDSSLPRSRSSLVVTVTVVSCTLLILIAAVCVLTPAAARISVNAFVAIIGTLIVAAFPSAVAQFFSTAAAQEARDKAAAEQRKADVAAQEARDRVAAKQRKAAAKQRKADAAAQEARHESLKSMITGFMKSTGHRIESVAVGLNNLRTDPATAQAPAVIWSAAEVSESACPSQVLEWCGRATLSTLSFCLAQVSAWFASSARWSQYRSNFAAFDGSNLFSLTTETQLIELGVLPGHAAELLSDVMRLV